MTPEKLIQRQISSYLRAKWPSIYFWTNDSVGIFDPIKKVYRSNKDRFRIKGVSDILGIHAPTGRFIAIEVKTETGRVTPDQKAFIDRINASNGVSFLARSIEDVERELNERL